MNRKNIIRMAQECQLIGMRPHLDGIYQEALERFAALVVASERERIIAANAPEIGRVNAYIESLEEAASRKPLSPEHILDISKAIESGDYWHLRFARAIEAAHGIKDA